MTGLINWFKTIFILEITGEIALKLVPPKYKGIHSICNETDTCNGNNNSAA